MEVLLNNFEKYVIPYSRRMDLYEVPTSNPRAGMAVTCSVLQAAFQTGLLVGIEMEKEESK